MARVADTLVFTGLLDDAVAPIVARTWNWWPAFEPRELFTWPVEPAGGGGAQLACMAAAVLLGPEPAVRAPMEVDAAEDWLRCERCA